MFSDLSELGQFLFVIIFVLCSLFLFGFGILHHIVPYYYSYGSHLNEWKVISSTCLTITAHQVCLVSSLRNSI
jgi:hypothetical protein